MPTQSPGCDAFTLTIPATPPAVIEQYVIPVGRKVSSAIVVIAPGRAEDALRTVKRNTGVNGNTHSNGNSGSTDNYGISGINGNHGNHNNNENNDNNDNNDDSGVLDLCCGSTEKSVLACVLQDLHANAFRHVVLLAPSSAKRVVEQVLMGEGEYVKI